MAAVGVIALLFLSPLLALFSRIDRAALTETLASPGFARSLQATLVSAGLGGALSLAIAIYFARYFGLHDWRGKRLQRLLALLPYLIPNFILASAYVIAWNPASGLLNAWLPFPSGLYGLTGMVVLFAVTHAPVALLMIEDKFRRMDSSWREAAQLSGARPARILLRIELPILLPTLLSAFALCFTLNISAFAIPAWIGAPERVYPLTYKVYQSIQVGGAEGIPQAASYSIVLFVLSLVPLALAAWVGRQERKFVLLSGKASRKAPLPAQGAPFAAFQAVFWILQTVTWIAPLAVLAVSTLVRPGCLQQSGLSCLGDASLRSYAYVLFDLKETRQAIEGSLAYGTLAALLILALSLGALAFFSGHRSRLRALELLFASLVATPGAVLALGLIVTLSGRYGVNLYNTPWILVAAYVLKHASLAFQPAVTGLSGVSSSLIEAARLSGARTGRVWRRILLPILKPELMGGFFLVLIPILGELTMSVFLSSPSFRPIGSVLFDLQDYADQASAAALSILLVCMVLALNELARLLSRGRLGY
jgi:iron(III) transport system permease protein